MLTKVMYQVWLGDTFILNTDDIVLATKTYQDIPSGKDKAPSKRRELIKCTTLKSD